MLPPPARLLTTPPLVPLHVGAVAVSPGASGGLPGWWCGAPVRTSRKEEDLRAALRDARELDTPTAPAPEVEEEAVLELRRVLDGDLLRLRRMNIAAAIRTGVLGVLVAAGGAAAPAPSVASSGRVIRTLFSRRRVLGARLGSIAMGLKVKVTEVCNPR